MVHLSQTVAEASDNIVKSVFWVTLAVVFTAAFLLFLLASYLPSLPTSFWNVEVDRALPNGYRIQSLSDMEMVVVGPDNALVFPPSTGSKSPHFNEFFPYVAVVSHFVYAERVDGRSSSHIGYFVLDTTSGSVLMLANLSDVERVLSQSHMHMGELEPVSTLPPFSPNWNASEPKALTDPLTSPLPKGR